MFDDSLPDLKLSRWLNVLRGLSVKPAHVYRTKGFGQKQSMTAVVLSGVPDPQWLRLVLESWSEVFLGGKAERRVSLTADALLNRITSFPPA